MRTTNSFALLIFIAILGVGVALAYAMYGTSTNWGSIWIIAGAFVIGLVVSYGIRVANLSFPKIISAHSDDAIRTRLVW